MRIKSLRGLLASLAVVSIVLCGQAAPAATVQDVVNDVSQATYSNYLDNLLYTGTGDNRGFSGSSPTTQHDAARDNILSHFNTVGLTGSLDPFTYGSYTGANNVVGVLTGTTRPNDIYIVGAHYDSAENPGADDNASGVAGVMEAARVLSQYRFEATIIFIAFDLEEKGLLGSDYYATNHSGDNILGMISLDMIAYNPDGSHKDEANIYGRTPSSTIKSDLAAALTAYTDITPVIGGAVDASDHAPFEDEGFQACLLIEYNVWSNPYYHQQTDTVDSAGYIDYAYATQMTAATVGYLTEKAVLVPEPGSMLIMSVSMTFIAIRRRRGRKTGSIR